MGKNMTPAKIHHMERVTRELRAKSSTTIRPRRDQYHVDPSRPPWHVRHLASMIVGGFFSVVLMVGVLLVSVVNQDVVPATDPTEVKALVSLAERMMDVIEGQNEERQAIQAEEVKQDQITKTGLIFWTILAGVFLMFAVQFSGLWGIGIGMMMILMIIGIWTGHIFLQI